MHKTVSIAEGKRDFTGILKEAESKKEDIVVTRRGEPVCVIMPFEEYRRIKRIRSYLRMLEISRELKGKRVKLSSLLKESRKQLEERY
jgi:prevent-host-death family protein